MAKAEKVETHDDKNYFNGAIERFINLWVEGGKEENPWEQFCIKRHHLKVIYTQ